jgi:integrase
LLCPTATRTRNPPREGFFEHDEYLKVRAQLPASYQDVLDFAYYSGWRRNEILGLTWDEVDLKGGVIRLPPQRSKTRTGRVLPISPPLQQVLKRRQRLKQPKDPRVFRRDGVPVRAWRSALRDACRKAKVPHRLLHDCRRTAARNLIRAGVPERIAMLLTGHKTRAVFDRYNIVNEQELLTAGERLAAYVAKGQSRLSPRMGRATSRPTTVGPHG